MVDLAGVGIKRGKQRGCSVAFVVVGRGGTATLLHGQSGLGAVQRLNLTLLVDRQDQRVLGRVEKYADNVLQFGGEIRIVADLEAFYTMRFRSVGVPNAPHTGLVDVRRASHGARGPVALGSLAIIALILTAFGIMLGIVKPADAMKRVGAILGVVIMLSLVFDILTGICSAMALWQIALAALVLGIWQCRRPR